MVQKWVDSGKVGKISEVKVWTNRPVWPQGIKMPDPDVSLKPKSLNWDLWLGPASENLIHQTYTHLIGGAGGIMALGH